MITYNSVYEHFSSIKPLPHDALMCNVIFPVKVWQLKDDVESFRQIDKATSVKEFEDKFGPQENWKPVNLIAKPQLERRYKESLKYINSTDYFYIVKPTEQFKELPPHSAPEVWENYLMLDKYSALREKLPELEGIF